MKKGIQQIGLEDFAKNVYNGIDKVEAQMDWNGMPEFIQEKQEPYAKIIIRFRNEGDLQEFAKLTGQKLTKKTKSMWHPYKSHFREEHKEWVDES